MADQHSVFSLPVLVAVNLIPLLGVLFYGWDAAFVLALFWIENLVIGGFNILKMLLVAFVKKRARELFLIVFFVFHYGMFCAVHGTLLWEILNLPPLQSPASIANLSYGPLEILLDSYTVSYNFIERYGTPLALACLALVGSHAIRFIENFILSGELYSRSANKLMTRPYSQIMIMHVGLIVGAMVLQQFESAIWLLLLMVAFKLITDVMQYRRRRRNERNQTQIQSVKYD